MGFPSFITRTGSQRFLTLGVTAAIAATGALSSTLLAPAAGASVLPANRISKGLTKTLESKSVKLSTSTAVISSKGKTAVVGKGEGVMDLVNSVVYLVETSATGANSTDEFSTPTTSYLSMPASVAAGFPGKTWVNAPQFGGIGSELTSIFSKPSSAYSLSGLVTHPPVHMKQSVKAGLTGYGFTFNSASVKGVKKESSSQKTALALLGSSGGTLNLKYWFDHTGLVKEVDLVLKSSALTSSVGGALSVTIKMSGYGSAISLPAFPTTANSVDYAAVAAYADAQAAASTTTTAG